MGFKMFGKRLLSAALTLSMVAGMMVTGVGAASGGWVQVVEPSGDYTYELDTDGIDQGQEYLIVGATAAYALDGTGGSISRKEVTLHTSNNVSTATVDSGEYDWTITSDGKITNGTYWLNCAVDNIYGVYVNAELSLVTGESDATEWLITGGSQNGTYRIFYTYAYEDYKGKNQEIKYYLRYYTPRYGSEKFDLINNETSVRLFGYKSAPAGGSYAKIDGTFTYAVPTGKTEDEVLNIVKAGITGYTNSTESDAGAEPLDDEELNWTIANYNANTPGNYTVTIKHKESGNTLGTATVTVKAATVTNVTLSSNAGQVPYNADPSAQTGSVLTVTYSDGTTAKIPVTVEMLSGDFDTGAMSKGEDGKYQNVVCPGLTVTYGGKTFTDFTLTVLPPSDYPEYPEQGAVRVNKTVEGINFQSTGVAKVELSATGVPQKKGADLIVMLDMSSSMTKTVSGTNSSRLNIMKNALNEMVGQLQKNGEDGEPMDIRISVASFNGYYDNSASPYYINPSDHPKNTKIRTNASSAEIYTGSKKIDATSFVSVHSLGTDPFYTDNFGGGIRLSTGSGTNYDYAFDAVYQLGTAIQGQNKANGEDRDLFVIFMSDGAPYQFNYFSSENNEAGNYWGNWLQGTFTDTMYGTNANRTYYNAEGKHWMAEAIKGDPNTTYRVIRKNNAADTDGDNWVEVNGLGADLYSIGFCLAVDKAITVDMMEDVLQKIASPDVGSVRHYYSVNSADALSGAFNAIGSEIAYAATNARFVDQLGSTYDLVLGPVKDKKGQVVFRAPEIIVQAYDIYTQADVDAGMVTADKIGVRKGTSTVLEKVTFNGDGTQAYSDKKSGNILVDGVICANSFWYNTTSAAKEITLVDGSTYSLPPETFYWNMGTVNTTELALSYYVYLTGANEGLRGAGSYATNEYATLYYDNYLGNQAEMGTTSPTTAWESASVNYAFYLVNDNGEIVVNQTTGQTGSFANRVAVTQPVMYKEILLNNSDNITSINIASMGVLPVGYKLYDEGAEYKINIDATSTGSWEIKKGEDAATTYVTDFKGTEYSNALTENSNSYDYTHTTVWFAVKWTIGTVPDSVVIDYGLPVDITVLGNDMFGENGTLAAIGETKPSDIYTDTLASGFGTGEVKGKYGTLTINGDKVRYTPTTMQMTGEDAFAYAVQYNGMSYYYGTVTVIPATLMYYEEGFVTNYAGTWTTDGTTNTAAIQDEDRPGFFSLSTVDANNLYGYDSAYANMTKYSMGSAKKATVSGTKEATASFTFTGTGFDVISLTSSNSGTITVEVTKLDGTLVRDPYLVDTYYGYSYGELKNEKNEPVLDENGKQAMGWYVDPHTPNTLYQVPVMKVTGLGHGTYTATITAAYGEVFDHVGDGSYDFYLDAVRIYDPANDGADSDVIKNAYIADKEYLPEYVELRDILIEANGFGTNGSVFIDGYSNLADITMYQDFGPNNELYLASGQSVSFELDAASISGGTVESVQIGLSSTGGTAVAEIQGGGVSKTVSVGATDMYYDITEMDNSSVTITNMGSDILSVTNIKVTLKAPN